MSTPFISIVEIHQRKHNKCRSASKGADFYLHSNQGFYCAYCQTAKRLKPLVALSNLPWSVFGTENGYPIDEVRLPEVCVADAVKELSAYGSIAIIDTGLSTGAWEPFLVCTVPHQPQITEEDAFDAI